MAWPKKLSAMPGVGDREIIEAIPTWPVGPSNSQRLVHQCHLHTREDQVDRRNELGPASCERLDDLAERRGWNCCQLLKQDQVVHASNSYDWVEPGNRSRAMLLDRASGATTRVANEPSSSACKSSRSG